MSLIANKATLIAFIAALTLSGCASTANKDEMDALRAQVEKAANDAAAAKTEAADALSSANAAKSEAANATSLAREAKDTAAETESKIDRMFKKAMYK